MEKYLTTGSLNNQDFGRFFDLTQQSLFPVSSPSLAREIIFKRESEKGTIIKTSFF